MQYPTELTPALTDALGLMNFQTGPIAHIYRAAGHDIPRKCEAEQAFVLHRCILLALEHGEDWRNHAQAELDRMKAQIAATAQPGPVQRIKDEMAARRASRLPLDPQH